MANHRRNASASQATGSSTSAQGQGAQGQGAAASPAPSRRARWIAAAALVAFAALLLLPYFHGHWRLADDSYEIVMPLWRFQERVLKLGQWPHWNLGEGFGKPTAVSSASLYYYPPVPLWGLIVGWSEMSYLVFLFLHLAVGALLASRFARRTGLSLEAAVFFGLAYIGNGFAMGLCSNPCILFPYLWWPLLGDALLDFDRQTLRKGAAMAKTAIALVLIETGGYPLTKILIYLSTAILAHRVIRRHWRPLAGAGVLAIAASSPEWVPAIAALPLSDRMGSDIYQQVSYDSPSNFMTLGSLFVPTAFLKRDGIQLGMAWLERSWWVGAVTLGVAFAAFRQGWLRLGRYRAPLMLALAGFLFSLGGHSFFREFASVTLPLLEHLRFANMGRVIPMVCLAYLGAAGLDAVRAHAPAQPASSARKRVSSLWLAFGLACLVAALTQVSSSSLSAGLYFDPETEWWLGGLHTAFYLLLAYSVYALRASVGRRAGWVVLVVAVQFLSLADTGFAFRHLVAKDTTGGIRAAEPPFVLASPQPNERSLHQWLDGEDWTHWEGNRKVLFAYTVPFHRWMRETVADPKTRRFASTLASCQDNPAEAGLRPMLPGAHSCAGAQMRIDRYYGNTIEITGYSSAPAWVMVHDFVDPGWTAELDGAATPIETAYGRFKAIEVPAATESKPWRVRLDYRPAGFPLLWLIAALGLASIAALAAWGWIGRKIDHAHQS